MEAAILDSKVTKYNLVLDVLVFYLANNYINLLIYYVDKTQIMCVFY